MANYNKVTLIGRLTRDPETRAFANGGMVAKFGFAVTNRKKNSQTGQWEDEPMYIDCEVFNRGEFGKLADLVRDRCHKGTQIFIEGRLHLDTWQDKTTGQNRSKHKVVVESIQLLDPRQPGEGGGNYPPRSGGGFSSPPAMASDGPPDDGGAPDSNPNGDIPF
jgi:single-strand DNA-binding protein